MAETFATTEKVLDRCRELGFALAGVADAGRSRWGEQLRQWLASNRHGEMQYMADHVDLRLDPAAMVPGAASVICVADRYHTGHRDAPQAGPARGRIARYARGDDYHKVMKRRLHELCDDLQRAHPDEQFRACVDTAPVLERELAQRSGIGAVGKNTLLLEQGVGSYLLLGEVITTLPLEPTPDRLDVDPCGTCTRCIDACPTDAITPWSVDATRCISYLTIEHRGTIEPEYHEPIGDWIFGCDICQEVCPHNRPTRRSRAQAVHETYAPRTTGFGLLEVLNWTEQDRRDAFTRSSMKRAKLGMMKRNALIAAGNALQRQDDAPLRQRVAAIADDEREVDLVRATARQVLEKLAQRQSG